MTPRPKLLSHSRTSPARPKSPHTPSRTCSVPENYARQSGPIIRGGEHGPRRPNWTRRSCPPFSPFPADPWRPSPPSSNDGGGKLLLWLAGALWPVNPLAWKKRPQPEALETISPVPQTITSRCHHQTSAFVHPQRRPPARRPSPPRVYDTSSISVLYIASALRPSGPSPIRVPPRSRHITPGIPSTWRPWRTPSFPTATSVSTASPPRSSASSSSAASSSMSSASVRAHPPPSSSRVPTRDASCDCGDCWVPEPLPGQQGANSIHVQARPVSASRP